MSTLVASNLQASGGGGTAATLASINGGPISGARNRIINGDMRIDQRNAGASVTVASGTVGYTVDRWGLFSNGATQTAQKVSVSITGFQYGLQITGATSATSATVLQRIESLNIADLAGSSVTLSFRVFNSGTTNNVGVQPYYPNTTDNYSSSTTFSGTNLTIPNGWSTQTYTFTLDANCTRGLGLDFQFGALASGATRILTGVQLEAGSVATPFERRNYAQELALCQRYFYKLPAVYNQLTKNGMWESAAFYFPVTMRAAPTMSSSSSWALRGLNASADTGYSGFSYASTPECFYVASSTTNNANFYTWVGPVVLVSAEL